MRNFDVQQFQEQKDACDPFEKIMDQINRLTAEKEKELLKCHHQNKDGKVDLFPVSDEKGAYSCKRCKNVFAIDPYSKVEVDKVVTVIEDVCHQIKMMANISTDMEYIRSVAEVQFAVRELAKVYDKMKQQRATGHSNNKPKRRSGSIGSKYLNT